MHHVRYHHISWTEQNVCLSSVWLGNPMTCSFHNISSSFLYHFMIHLLLEFLPLLSSILVFPCVWQLPLSFPSTDQTYHNFHWTWCISWLLLSTLFLPSSLMSSYSIWVVTSCLMNCVKIPPSQLVVLSLFDLNFKTMVTWWYWPTSFLIVFRISQLRPLLSHC